MTREQRQPLRRADRRIHGPHHVVQRIGDHPRAGGEVRGGVDDDEAAGRAVLGVAVEHQRTRG